METVRTPSPIAEEVDNDELSSSAAYVQTIKRIIQRTQRIPELSTITTSQSLPFAQTARARTVQDRGAVYPTSSRDSEFLSAVDFGYLNPENRSLYSLNEFVSSNNAPRFDDRGNQLETSFVTCDNDISTTDAQAFEFVLSNSDDGTYKNPPPFARRYFASSMGSHQHEQDGLSGDGLSDSSEPDLNTKWSWKSLKREFRLSHSESLFHLYQAKLQHSFFVALLILNIIFNFGAIVSYLASVYQEINLCKYNYFLI